MGVDADADHREAADDGRAGHPGRVPVDARDVFGTRLFRLVPFPAPSGGAALSAFDGTNPNGVWRLYGVDDDTTSLGRFAGGRSLEIKARVRR